MPIWLQILATVLGVLIPTLSLIGAVARKVSYTSQHFDPKSPVGQTVGTVPSRLNHMDKELDEIKEHLRDVTVIWRPAVENHQQTQDRRLAELEKNNGR